MASISDIVQKLPELQELLEDAGKKLPQRSATQDDESSSKNAYGEIVNDEDFEVQKFLYKGLRGLFPNDTYIGEEDIHDEGCSDKFPAQMNNTTRYWVIDPIDGSNNYRNKRPDYGITIGVLLNRRAVFGMAYEPVSGNIYIGGTDLPTTINNKPVPASKHYDPEDVFVAYGVGKRKPEEERERFITQVKGLADQVVRPGCATVSVGRVLEGKVDAYLSLKEAATNIVPLIAILAGTDLIHNVDFTKLDLNEPFCMIVATPKFHNEHLKSGSPLAKSLEN